MSIEVEQLVEWEEDKVTKIWGQLLPFCHLLPHITEDLSWDRTKARRPLRAYGIPSASSKVNAEEFRLVGYKIPGRTSRETHYVSATEPSLLILYKIMRFPRR
jgi:hypothetical protein